MKKRNVSQDWYYLKMMTHHHHRHQLLTTQVTVLQVEWVDLVYLHYNGYNHHYIYYYQPHIEVVQLTGLSLINHLWYVYVYIIYSITHFISLTYFAIDPRYLFLLFLPSVNHYLLYRMSLLNQCVISVLFLRLQLPSPPSSVKGPWKPDKSIR